MHLYPIDGAVHRQKKDATAWGYRDAAWSMVISGVDPDPANAPALKKWARDYWEAVHPFDLAGAYANFMMDDEGEGARQGGLSASNYDRLGGAEEEIRSGESVPGEPEHPPGGLNHPGGGGGKLPPAFLRRHDDGGEDSWRFGASRRRAPRRTRSQADP